MTPHTDNRHDSLWALITGPTVWLLYFLIVYATAAVRCARLASPDADIFLLRAFILGLGGIALVLIAWAGLVAWRRWRSHHDKGGTEKVPPHGDDTEASRSQFLALSTLLLCGVSFIATVFVALPAVFFASCR